MEVKCAGVGCKANYGKTCRCGYCPEALVCEECAVVHRRLARFFNSLLATKPTQRADSARGKGLEIFIEAGGKILAGRERAYFFDLLREVNAWTTSRYVFEPAVRRAISVLPLNRELLHDITQRADNLYTEHLLTKAYNAMVRDTERKNQEEKFARSFMDLIDAIDREERLRAI